MKDYNDDGVLTVSGKRIEGFYETEYEGFITTSFTINNESFEIKMKPSDLEYITGKFCTEDK